jgi:hypothetical protein
MSVELRRHQAWGSREGTDMTTQALLSMDDLCRYVREQLCAQQDLDPRYTPFYHSVLRKQGRPCGMFFHVQGPRQVRAYAIWTADENRLLFYDGQGNRFSETTLSDGAKLTTILGLHVLQ